MPNEIRYEWQAIAAINSLGPAERAHVEQALARLREGQFDGVPQVYRIRAADGSPGAYVIRAGDDLRILFTKQDASVINIQDVVNRRFVQRYG